MSDKPLDAKWLETYFKHVRRAMTFAEVDVPHKLRAGTTPRRVYVQRAMDKARRYVAFVPPGTVAWLAHGDSALGLVMRDHAWVELPGGVVFDGLMQRFYCKSWYRFLQQSTASYLYSQAAVGMITLAMYAHNKLWMPQPWARVLELPKAEPGHPLVVNGRLAREFLLIGVYREFVLPYEGDPWSQDESRPD